MNPSLSEGLNTPFGELQVTKEFSYQEYLQIQARLAAEAINLHHPLAVGQIDLSVNGYMTVGGVYVRQPDMLPPGTTTAIQKV